MTLIKECCESFYDIILCLFGFCDDACLLSESKEDLVKICKTWAI